jgi:hypothetical protein
MTGLPSARARRLGDALADWPRRRIRLDELWGVLDKVEPTTRTDSRRRRILDGLIAELAAAGEIELPSTRSYDHTELPALPRFLSLRRETTPPQAPRRPPVWHPSLAWVPTSPLISSHLERLERVNDWLQANRDPLVVPSRERSVEIFGDEKALDRLIGTALFTPGRLGLELLRCRRVVPRLHCETVGSGGTLLVVENSDTFDSLVTVLGGRNDHRVGLVGWGAGAGFEASVLSIADLGRTVSEISYFGDLDENGLRIPASAALIAEGAGLPPVRPATGLYGALFSRGNAQSGQRRVPADTAANLAAWLDSVHWEEAAGLLSAGLRLAQEWVGLSYLSRSDDWLRIYRLGRAESQAG